jgi:serine phosphatase RsbU (regulator of sigma subunit)
MAPTGKEIELKGITIFRFSPEGKVVETWDSYDQLSLMRHSVEQELRVARSIQQASLPKEVPQLEGWQISPFYRPAREVGGDFYDFFELQEGRGGVVVGDATGKGMPAALVAGAASNMLRAVAQALGSSSSPGEVLAQVNETLLARIPANMFVTCFYAIVEDESGGLLYANAGHNLPCCRRDDEHAAATTTTDLSARGMPLGIMPQMNYEEKESVLVPGEGVLFYTDGLVEAHNSQGEMFGTPRLRSLLSERPEAGRGMSATLMEELERFTGKGREQEDDITLLTLERSATRS